MSFLDERDMIPVGTWGHAEPARRCSYPHCTNLTTFIFNTDAWLRRYKGTLLTACRQHRLYLWTIYRMDGGVPDKESA